MMRYIKNVIEENKKITHINLYFPFMFPKWQHFLNIQVL